MVIPDGRVGWYFDSVNVGKKILGENKIDAIFSSPPPYTTHLIAKNLASQTTFLGLQIFEIHGQIGFTIMRIKDGG